LTAIACTNRAELCRASLKVGNIALALNGITPGLQVNYNSIFTGVANLATTVDQFGVLQQGAINEEFAEYLLRRSAVGGDVGHLIYFVQDSDGIWRIGGM
jgi:hypothetical protein